MNTVIIMNIPPSNSGILGQWTKLSSKMKSYFGERNLESCEDYAIFYYHGILSDKDKDWIKNACECDIKPIYIQETKEGCLDDMTANDTIFVSGLED